MWNSLRSTGSRLLLKAIGIDRSHPCTSSVFSEVKPDIDPVKMAKILIAIGWGERERAHRDSSFFQRMMYRVIGNAELHRDLVN